MLKNQVVSPLDLPDEPVVLPEEKPEVAEDEEGAV